MYDNFSSRININKFAKMVKTWQEKRINAINRKIKKGVAKGFSAQDIAENYIEEHFNICNSKAKSKKEYKASLELF
jgi:ribonucleotide reductase alpha subunit|tara:strand:- start:224 stop:451 length:228 start_codon:yes stop_codon:yes gene_type:complete